MVRWGRVRVCEKEEAGVVVCLRLGPTASTPTLRTGKVEHDCDTLYLSGVCRRRTDLGVLCRRTGLGDLAVFDRLCQEVHLHAIGPFNDLKAVSHNPVRGLLHLLPHDVVEKRRSS